MSMLKLQKNKNVLNVSEKAITYTDEFKRLFIDEYMSGKLPRDIFIENSFDVEIIGMKRIEQSACRWKAMYKANGIIGLTDTRKGLSGRPLARELTPQEIIERQEAKIKLLESQVELLKKLKNLAFKIQSSTYVNYRECLDLGTTIILLQRISVYVNLKVPHYSN
ncbi:MAG TPA: HTH domain-containing protein [Clostridium sp.]|uniref:HTH domain-containing protein n=1 Tax=Clostridium sp. TaxID=1506 RepID=UPI002F94483C